MRYLFLFYSTRISENNCQKLNGEILDKLSGEPISFVLIKTENPKHRLMIMVFFHLKLAA